MLPGKPDHVKVPNPARLREDQLTPLPAHPPDPTAPLYPMLVNPTGIALRQS